MPEKSGMEVAFREPLSAAAGDTACAHAGGEIVDSIVTNKRKSRRCMLSPFHGSADSSRIKLHVARGQSSRSARNPELPFNTLINFKLDLCNGRSSAGPAPHR